MLQGFQNKFVVIYNRYLDFRHLEKSKIGLVNAMVLTADIEVSDGSCRRHCFTAGNAKKHIKKLVISSQRFVLPSLRRDLWSGTSAQQQRHNQLKELNLCLRGRAFRIMIAFSCYILYAGR